MFINKFIRPGRASVVADVFAGDERAGQERRDEGFGGGRRAADDDLDAVLLEKLLGARAHAAGEEGNIIVIDK